MNFFIKNIIKKNEGAALVEFAIVLPLLLTLIFGTIEFGLFLYNQQVITNAAREGARRGVIVRSLPRDVDAENADIETRINHFAQDNLVTFGTGSLSIVPLSSTRSLAWKTDLVIELNYLYDFLFLSTIPGLPDSINIHSISTMKME